MTSPYPAGTPVSPTGSDSTLAPAPMPPALAGAMSGMDAASQKALMLGLTNIVRSVLMSRGVNFRESFILSLADYVYQKLVAAYLQPLLQSWSKETMYSSYVAEALGLTLVLMLTKKLGITSSGEVPQGAVDAPRIGGGMVGEIIESSLQAGELVIERGILGWGLAKTGFTSY